MENKIISVERILQYMSIREEPPLSMSEDKLAHDWPSQGEIQLHDLHVNPLFLHYKVALKNLYDFFIVNEFTEIKSGKKTVTLSSYICTSDILIIKNERIIICLVEQPVNV